MNNHVLKGHLEGRMKYKMKFYELLPIFFIISALIIPFAFNLHFLVDFHGMQ